ncbi:MAG: DUF4338 domain-containing protein [Candidatus Synoicihabitans palmerolidicus]|nr:DUF4338 domain-containing protein [Candidatus Synoicihabitans palmerolidicus]
MSDQSLQLFEKTTRPNRRQRYLLDHATIRLLDDQAEIERWNDLIRTHHYLRSANVAGTALRYVVEVAGKWAALLSFSSAVYHLKGTRQLHWLGSMAAPRTARCQQPLADCWVVALHAKSGVPKPLAGAQTPARRLAWCFWLRTCRSRDFRGSGVFRGHLL